MILDDILSAIDAKTESLVVERLFGKAGLLKQLNSTTILATHAGKCYWRRKFKMTRLLMF